MRGPAGVPLGSGWPTLGRPALKLMEMLVLVKLVLVTLMEG